MNTDWLNFTATVIAIIVGGFIAYHIYFLSKRLGFRDEMSTRAKIRELIHEQLIQVRTGVSSKVELVNVEKYKKHYPQQNDRKGWSYLTGELKSLRFNGVELFCDMVQEVYKDKIGNLTLEKTGSKEKYVIFPVGLVPYDWIEFVDLEGDEFTYRPQIFVKFKGVDKSPYSQILYYKKRESAKETDSNEMKYEQVDIV